MNSHDPDVIAIGSGFGGGISANRLALAGLKVLVLERGPWRDSLPVRFMGIERHAPFLYGIKFVTHFLRAIQTGRRKLTLNKSGMYEVFSYPGLDVFAVSAVGGGSHGWFGMLTEPRAPAYWRDRHPDLNPTEVEKYYAKVMADMGAVRLSQDNSLRHSIWKELPDSPGGKCLSADPQPYIAMRNCLAPGLKTWALKKPITVHAWGGACLGASPESGVVDHKGEVYGNPGLFVGDAAALPAAIGTPPSLAIAAWADHVAQTVALIFTYQYNLILVN